MRNLFHISALCAVITMTACGSTAQKEVSEPDANNIIAAVDGNILTTEDLQRDMPAGITGMDSITFARMYIDNWVLTELKINHATTILPTYESDIERLVEDYRRSLIIRSLDQYYVDHSIDLDINDQQILAHYRSNKAAFRLDHTKVQGIVVRVPKAFRNTSTLTTALKRAKTGDSSEVIALCEKHQLDIVDLSTAWVSFDDFLSYLPTERKRSYDYLLDNNNAQQMSGDDATFHFIITDIARKGTTAPLECVKENIRRMLYSERRATIVKQYEDELRQKAMVEGRVVIGDSILRNSTYHQQPQQPTTSNTPAIREIDEMEASRSGVNTNSENRTTDSITKHL